MKITNSKAFRATIVTTILLIAQFNVLCQNSRTETVSQIRVDRYGQLKSASFPSKVTTDQELLDDAKADKLYYDNLKPPVLDIYGGLPGSKEKFDLKATGFFHIEKLANGRTVMVNPLGNVYFSLGVDCTGSVGDTYTFTKGRENIYEWLPEYTTDNKSINNQYNTAFLNQGSDNFSYYVANKIRKTNQSFSHDAFYDESVTRLKKWGFTSEGGFSNPPRTKPNNNTIFPQVRFANLPKQDLIPGTSIFDIFKPTIQANIHESFERQGIAARSNDPLIIGYFFGNEFEYHRLKNILPSKKSSEVASKAALVNFLKAKYNNDITPFNKAWETSYARFDDLHEAVLNISSNEASEDMYCFIEIFMDKFYSLASTEFRKFDTNHMLLGDRYFTAPMNDEKLRDILCKIGGKYLDVISYNYYTYEVDLKRLETIHKISGKPVMITEFHYGEPTQGQTSAVQMMDNEKEKGLAYRNYVEKIAATGFVVGIHWFEFLDEAITGRWFQGYTGESFAIGLLNVTDRPYKEFLNSVMETNYNIYDLMLGNKVPYSYDFGLGKAGRDMRNSVNIPKTTQPVIIDGVKDAMWPQGEVILIEDKDRVTGLKQENASAKMNLCWDDSNLYVFAFVSDLTPMVNENREGDIWNGDAVELFIGAFNVDQGGAIQAKDAQIILGACSDHQPHYFWANGAIVQHKMVMAIKMDDHKKGYYIEAAIPLDKLYITGVSAEKQIRFDIGFDAGDERQRNAQYVWNGDGANSQRREKWGMAKLME